MYNKKVLSIFQDPKNAGGMKGANGTGKVGEVGCGDIMKFYLQIEDEVIQEARFKVYGCCAAIASADVVCDLVKGMPVSNALSLTSADVIEVLEELPSNKVYCASLAVDGIKDAIADYHKRLEKLQKKEQAQEGE